MSIALCHIFLLTIGFTGHHAIHASTYESVHETNADTFCRWQPIGRPSIPRYIITGKEEGSGRVDRILFNPGDSNTCFLASPGGGLWKTTNYAGEWTPLTDHLPVTGVADVAISWKDPDQVWIATGDAFTDWSYADGIYHSSDGGISWEPTSLHFAPADTGMVIHRISLNPQNDRSLFAGTSAGLYHSANAGASFQKITDGRVRDIEWLDEDSTIMLFTLADTDGRAMICRNLEGGVTHDTAFRLGGPVIRIEIAVAQDVAYAVMADTSGNLYGVFRSDSEGNNWEMTSPSRPNILGWTCEGSDNWGAGQTIMSLAVNPSNTSEIYAGSNYLWKSTDGGQTWSACSGWCGGGIPYVRPYHRSLAFGPDKKIYTGSGGGIFRSSDAGTSWVNISRNLFIMPITAISASADTGFLVAGTLENGNMRIRQQTWEFIADGDGLSPLVFDSLSFFIQLQDALTRKIKLLKTDDGGYNYHTCTPPDAEGEVYSRVIPHPGQDNILYFSYGPFFRSTDGGLTWEVLADRGPDESFQFLGQSGLKPSLWYGAHEDRLWRSVDGGKQWEVMLSHESMPGMEGKIKALRISRSDPNLLWVGLSTGSLLESDNGGQLWEDVSTGLQGGPVHSLEYDHTLQLLFAGTQQGVWVRDHNKRWTVYGSDLPHCRITDLHLDLEHKVIFAATLGRGIWKAPLLTLDDQPVPDFELSAYMTCGGSATWINGKATGPVDSWDWDFGEGATPAGATGAGPHKVSYQGTGFKTIRLTINDSIELIKKNLVEVVSAIQVEVLADRICSDDTVSITAFGADDYEWSPTDGLITDNGHGAVRLFPKGVVTYVVKGTTGNCVDQDTVIIETLADERNQAFLITPGMNGPFTNACATASVSDPVVPTGSIGTGCSTQDGWCKKRSLTHTVWFRFQVPASGCVSLEAPGDFNNQMALFGYDQANDSLVLLAANDDYFGPEGNNAAAITGVCGLEAGATGIIMIDGGGAGETGEFYLLLHDSPLDLEQVADHQLRCYPNPASGFIWITGIREDCRYQIISPEGRILKAGMLRKNGDGEKAKLELTGLAGPFVIIRLINEDVTRTGKLMILE